MIFYVGYPIEYPISKKQGYYNFLNIPEYKKKSIKISDEENTPLWASTDLHGYAFQEDITNDFIILYNRNNTLCINYKKKNYTIPTRSVSTTISNGYFNFSYIRVHSLGKLAFSIKYLDPICWIRATFSPFLNGLNYRGKAWDSLLHKINYIVDTREYRSSIGYEYAKLDEWKSWISIDSDKSTFR